MRQDTDLSDLHGYEIDASWGVLVGWLVEFPALPNVFAAGSSLPSARVAALAAVLDYVDMLIAQGFPVPVPVVARSGDAFLVLPSIVAIRIAQHNDSIRPRRRN